MTTRTLLFLLLASGRQAPASSLKRRRVARRRSPEAGLTLVELLVALIITTIILATAGATLVYFLRASIKFESGQYARESSNRLNYLIHTESSEAREVKTGWTRTDYPYGSGTAIAACQFSASSTPLFALLIPQKVGSYGVTGVASPVYYYQQSGNIRRCGPEPKANGALQESTAADGSTVPVYVDGIAMVSASLDMVTAAAPAAATCGAEVTDDKLVVFNTNFTGIQWKPPCTVARARTVYVCTVASTKLRTDVLNGVKVLPTGYCPLT